MLTEQQIDRLEDATVLAKARIIHRDAPHSEVWAQLDVLQHQIKRLLPPQQQAHAAIDDLAAHLQQLQAHVDRANRR